MQNRPEDTPKVIALSLAIVAVFGTFVWQRLHGTPSGPVAALSSPRTPGVTVPSTDPPVPGQVRYLDDAALESPPASTSRLQSNPFVPIHASDPGAGTSIRRPTTNLLPSLPGVMPVQAAPLRVKPTPRPLSIVLDGVIGDGAEAEAWLTIRDPKGSDPSVGERTVVLHLGDLLGARAVTGIGVGGLELYHDGWWRVGEERILVDAGPVLRPTHAASVAGKPSGAVGVQLIPPVKERSLSADEASIDAGIDATPERNHADR
jgi:hypothetical protein